MEANDDPRGPLPVLVSYDAAAAVSRPLAEVRRWLETFVLQPHPLLGREGAVCPFLGPAIRQGTLLLSERTLRSPVTEPLVRRELFDCARSFHEQKWSGPNHRLHAMLVLFPHLIEAEAAILHDAHNAIKNDLLRQDVMMSPFHPECADQAARNSELRAFRSPVPMVAVRRLAFHDILFLHHERDRFWHYARRFGRRYRNPAALDPLLVERYRTAVAQHGEPDRAEAGAGVEPG